MILSLIRIFLLISILKTSCTLDDIYKNCRDRERLIEPEKGDLYTLIDATLDQKLTLQCHYCGENDDGRPKIWYKIGDIGSPAPSEVDLDMNNNSTLARVHVNKEHSLIIHNFTENDTGLYYCERYEGEQQDKYNYLVDLIFHDNVTTLETGNITVWRKYHDEYFLPINMLFNHSEGVEFRHIREQLHVEMEMVTIWGPWGICQVCGRPKDEGIRKKVGYCRIKLTQKGSASLQNNTDLHFIKNANEIACRSKILGRILPGVSNLTRIIPNFVQTEACQGTCNPDAEGFSKGWKAGKTSAFKYRKIFVLAEGSHLTLVCPDCLEEER
nr:PREDICTED: uncharacterized protein LOC103312737 isoform X2 [Tribolium castaneum]|eukprot:XP_015834536.1 PREDICTED: uncharacterized protein LOC103312737 isoform X2 [Tribolium castaneum]